MQFMLLFWPCLLWSLPWASAQNPFMEIEFEPMEGGGPPEQLMQMIGVDMSPQARGGGGNGGAAREDEIDRAMAALLGGQVPPQMVRGAKRNAGQEEVVFSAPQAKRSRVPVDLFRSLFPGPLMIDDGGRGGGMASFDGPGFDGPDPLVMDMLQDMGDAFQGDLLPRVHRSGGARAPRSCQHDLKKHCSKERSQVHCLGQHQDDISEACRRDVGKSVPFLCSRAIDKFCDVMQTGILTCLGGHTKDLEGQCSDALIATRHVITKAKTQKASVKVSDRQAEPQPAPGGVAFLGTGTKQPQQGSPNTVRILDSAADLVAEATEHAMAEAKQDAARISGSASGSYLSWKLLVLVGLLAAFAYVGGFAGSPQKVYMALKPHMHIGEDRQPLRGGVELPKSFTL